jgi:hypothetical protein
MAMAIGKFNRKQLARKAEGPEVLARYWNWNCELVGMHMHDARGAGPVYLLLI